MRLKQILLFTGGLGMLISVLLFSFSQPSSFSFDFTQKKQDPDSPKLTPETKELTLDAKAIFGSNFTESFSQELAQIIVAQYPDGPENIVAQDKKTLPLSKISQSQAKTIVSQIKQEVPYFSEPDISVSDNTRLEKLSYLSDLKKTWLNHLTQFKDQDLLLLAYAANRENSAEARKTLAQYVVESDLALNELKQIAPPQSFKALHLQLMNLVSQTRHTAISFLIEANDPIRTSLAAYTYPELGQKYFGLASDFKEKLSQEDLTLSCQPKNIFASLWQIIKSKNAVAATDKFSCSCTCTSSTNCTCSCDVDVPVPLPVYIGENNASGKQVSVKDDVVVQVLNTYFEDLRNSETAKFQLAQTVQSKIMGFITDQSDTLCPEEQKYPDTLTCRRGVENWTAVMRDVEDNAKRVFYDDLAAIPNEIIGDPLEKQRIINNLGLIIDRNPVGNVIEEFLKKVYQNEPYHVAPKENTGEGASIHGDKGSLALALKQYFENYVKNLKETTKFMAELGGGWFGKWECVREIVNLDNGNVRCDPYGGYSYVITPGQMNTIANVILPTLDIEAAMNSTYFSVLKDYTALALDDDGLPSSGLMVDQALSQSNEASIGFMMPGSMGPTEIKPTCQIRTEPFEQHVLMQGDSDANSQRILTISVYANNGTIKNINLNNSDPSIANLVINEGQGDNINYNWSDSGTVTNVTATPKNPKKAQTEQILATITANKVGSDDKITISATIENPDNKKLGFETNTCTSTTTVTVIPAATCAVSIDPASLEFNGADIADWKQSGGIKYPQIKKDITFQVTFDPPITFAQITNTLKLQMTNNLRANNRSFILLPKFPSLTEPSQSSSLLGLDNRHWRKLEINDLGESTLQGEVTILGMTDPLCTLSAKIKSGERCSTSLCPHPVNGCLPGSTCSGLTMITESHDGGCRTAYCDYYTGVRFNDNANAYCINACP